MRLRPHLDSSYLHSVADMYRYNVRVWATCETCDGRREIDLLVLIDAKPWNYSLINRRCRCRLTDGCQGWNVFEYKDSERGPVRPLYDLWAQARWAGVTLPRWKTV